MSSKEDFTLSSLSLNSESDDWDRSETDITIHAHTSKSQNSVVFPSNGVGDSDVLGRTDGGAGGRCTDGAGGRDGRSLSELMRLHAEKGTDMTFSAEEVSRVADVLKQWINSGTSPYEGEDDFFARAQDDASWRLKRSSRPPMDINGRPRGQSESFAPRLADASSNI